MSRFGWWVGWGTAALALAATGCQTNVGDAGCRINRQVFLPPTPLTQLADARLEPAGQGFVLIGHDDTAVRWASIDWAGNLTAEQALPLPSGARKPLFALAGKDAANDTVLVGVVMDAANGSDAELRLIASPVAGPTDAAPGAAIVTFPGAAGGDPAVALGTGRPGINAGLVWVDTTDGSAQFVAVDALGVAIGPPTALDSAYAFGCLGFSAGDGDLTVSYQRFSDAASRSSWLIAEVDDTGMFMNWSLPIGQLTNPMGCGIVTPTPAGYAVAWQDPTGSWLSIHTKQTRYVESKGFASATDFGGPDVQPPIAGLAPFETGQLQSDGGAALVDFGIVLQRPRAVEVWRLDGHGVRRPGALILPSMEGNMGNASSVVVGKSLVVTYADYGVSAGRRAVIDASCY